MVKSEFNKKWKASKQPRKQRKYLYNAPLHLRHKLIAATLSKELRKKYEVKNIEVRKGDEVKIMRGKFKKKQGKVGSVDLKKTRISVDGIERSKKDGGKVAVWFSPSKVMIMSLNLDDRKRLKKIKKPDAIEDKTGTPIKTNKPSADTKQKTKSEDKKRLGKNSKPETSQGDSNVHKKK